MSELTSTHAFPYAIFQALKFNIVSLWASRYDKKNFFFLTSANNVILFRGCISMKLLLAKYTTLATVV